MSGVRREVSICIVTRGRPEELAVALDSCLAQRGVDFEILVYGDAQDRETHELVSSSYPMVKYFEARGSEGIPQLRNRGFRDAAGEYVFSLDDDAYYTSPETLRRTLDDFAAAPRAAVVAMRFIEPFVRASGTMRMPQRLGGEELPRLASYTGCAHAWRRSIALELGGYREFRRRYHEDRDMSIRLLDAGYEIVLGSAEVVVHLHSDKERVPANFREDVASSLLVDYVNIPSPAVYGVMLVHAVKLFAYKYRRRDFLRRLSWILAGLGECRRLRTYRDPVSRRAWRLYRMLPGHGPLPWLGPVPPPLFQNRESPPGRGAG